MKKIMFLDDNHHRHAVVRNQVHPYAAAYTSSQAIELLSKNVYDIVFLDHDLGAENEDLDPNIQQACDYDTGMKVVEWIIENRPVIESIVIHSLNTPAANQMYSKLVKAGYSVEINPFTYLKNELIDYVHGDME